MNNDSKNNITNLLTGLVNTAKDYQDKVKQSINQVKQTTQTSQTKLTGLPYTNR